MTPEQGAVWAYPQPDFTDDEIAFTLCSALLGRIHLSGHLDQMTDQQQALVAAAVDTYKRIRPDLAQAVPLWPLGLPGWTAPWLALAMRAPTATYVLAWHRSGLGEPDENETDEGEAGVVLPLPHLAGRQVTAQVSYPIGRGRRQLGRRTGRTDRHDGPAPGGLPDPAHDLARAGQLCW